MDIIPLKIQIMSLLGTVSFMYVIVRLIARGKLREEYSVVWIFCTAVLLVFSVWRQGLQYIAALLGVYYAPSLLFLVAIFAIICFLLHLSIVISRLQSQIKDLAHEIAYLKFRSGHEPTAETPEARPPLPGTDPAETETAGTPPSVTS
ncbi:DUF2304 domain-containing protein [Larkinella soli]|uniref:DUF2304 domain-containing protein n=1 Tax=Larkinella soli TaxID=1770527 RepID=UPI000FFB9FED|nr:DUF2304 domain-containing protein [Larkinella soli]